MMASPISMVPIDLPPQAMSLDRIPSAIVFFSSDLCVMSPLTFSNMNDIGCLFFKISIMLKNKFPYKNINILSDLK